MKNNLDKHIDDRVKSSFELFQKKAPMHLWDNIDGALDAEEAINGQIDEKVQDTYLNKPEVSAPAFLWEEIATELDGDAAIDAVVDEKIKNSFDTNLNKQVPMALWASISDGLDTKMPPVDAVLDDKLKESYLEQETAKTPKKVWFAINRQLNIDKMWINISNALDTNPVVSDWRKRMLRFMTAAALLLLLVKTCDYNPYPVHLKNVHLVDNELLTNKSKTVGTKEPLIATNADLTTINNTSALTKEKEVERVNNALNLVSKQVEMTTVMPSKNNSKKELDQAVTNTIPQTLRNQEEKNKVLSSPENTYENNKNREVIFSTNDKKETLKNKEGIKDTDEIEIASLEEKKVIDLTPEEKNNSINARNWAILNVLNPGQLSSTVKEAPIQLLDELKVVQKTTTKKNLIEGKLEAGAFMVVNSTMLLNNETREGFDQNSLTTNYFGLAANYGVWAAYRIFPKGSLVAEFSVNADNRQAYGTYDQGVFYIKEWVMKYNRMSIAYKHDLWSSDGDKLINTKVVAQGGIYVGVMREAKLFYDGVLVFDKLADYHQFDFGFKLALGQEILIDKFVIGYGLRSDVGITNIFRGNTSLNSKEDQTNIIHLGGYILLGYRF